jgi:hypothetical protein
MKVVNHQAVDVVYLLKNLSHTYATIAQKEKGCSLGERASTSKHVQIYFANWGYVNH